MNEDNVVCPECDCNCYLWDVMDDGTEIWECCWCREQITVGKKVEGTE